MNIHISTIKEESLNLKVKGGFMVNGRERRRKKWCRYFILLKIRNIIFKSYLGNLVS